MIELFLNIRTLIDRIKLLSIELNVFERLYFSLQNYIAGNNPQSVGENVETVDESQNRGQDGLVEPQQTDSDNAGEQGNK